MGNNVLLGNWMQIKGRVREEWGELTDDDMETIAGKRDLLVGKLQERYGWVLKDAEDKVDSFLAKASELVSDATDR